MAYATGGIMRTWKIRQTVEFQDWFDEADNKLKESIVEHVELLRLMGPHLGRPYADTIKGSSIKNLKELRFNCMEKVIRIFYVFDNERNGLLLIGGNKSSSRAKRFYEDFISLSEKIYYKQLKTTKDQKKNSE